MLAALFGLVACSSGSSNSQSSPDLTIVPDSTALAPGVCDPADEIAPPRVSFGGQTVDASLGLSSSGCSGTNGDGYISFNYDPALLDDSGGDGVLVITLPAGVTATVAWSSPDPIAETEPGRWSATVPDGACERVTIDLVSVSGTSTATYGVDVRRGGDTVSCIQRGGVPQEEPEDDTVVTLEPLPETSVTATTSPRPSTPPTPGPPSATTTTTTDSSPTTG